MQLSRNLGKFDRLTRLIVGVALLALVVTGTIGGWGYLGVVLVVTGFMNFCPIYRVFGFKTCSDC